MEGVFRSLHSCLLWDVENPPCHGRRWLCPSTQNISVTVKFWQGNLEFASASFRFKRVGFSSWDSQPYKFWLPCIDKWSQLLLPCCTCVASCYHPGNNDLSEIFSSSPFFSLHTACLVSPTDPTSVQEIRKEVPAISHSAASTAPWHFPETRHQALCLYNPGLICCAETPILYLHAYLLQFGE